MKLSLSSALRLPDASCIAFVGAGGKTTAIFKIARESSHPVVVTATTHLGTWQIKYADNHIIASDAAFIEQLEIKSQGVLLITGEIEGDRTKPVDDELLTQLYSYCKSHSIFLLIEADGSQQKPLKAWANHEPPIPSYVDHVVHVAGMNGLGKPLTDEFVHRAENFSEISGLNIGEAVTANSIMKVLIHKGGGLKNIPSGAKRSLILNQADTPEIQSIVHSMNDDLLPHFQNIVVTTLKDDVIHAVHEPIAGIILAAGEASRFGEPKQLLDWKGEPFVRVIAQTAVRSGLSPVVIVIGANSEKIEEAVQDLDVRTVHNNSWKSGQGSSIKIGTESLPPICGGAIFLLADQPQVNTPILHALMEKHAEALYPVVAPMVINQRANPVLFDRVTFPELMKIEGDTGGRSIFHNYRVEYLPWHDESLLLDVDTPEQYQRLISNEDL